MNAIRVLIVDDHAILRMGLASLLGTRNDIEVVGDAGDGPTAVRKAVRLKPDVAIVDLAMPGMDGVATTRELQAALPSLHMLILTTFGTSDGINAALEAGALGAIMKNASFNELVDAIKAVARGEKAVAPEIARILAEDPPAQKLSPRQIEILDALVRGLANSDIAVQLGISMPTVKEHLTALFTRLGAANRAEAVAIALRKRLVKVD